MQEFDIDEKENHLDVLGLKLVSIRKEFGLSQASLVEKINQFVIDESIEIKTPFSQVIVSNLENNLRGSIQNFIVLIVFYNKVYSINLNWILMMATLNYSKFSLSNIDFGIDEDELKSKANKMEDISKELMKMSSEIKKEIKR